MVRSIYFLFFFTLLSCEKNEIFSLKTIIYPDLSGTINIYGGSFPEGEKITLIANPNEFYEFIGWSGSESGNDSIINFIMNEDKIIFVEFRKKDSDGDGISDDIDLCNNTPYGLLVNNKGCTSLQADYDKDGILNNLDVCSNTPPNTSVSSNGCPLIYLDENGVTLKATDAAIDSIGKIVLFENQKILIIKEWDDIIKLKPSSFNENFKIVTTFLTNTSYLCSTPCKISEKFDLSVWDVSNVESMNYTFWNTNSFEQDISNWDVSKVEDMEGLFFYSYKVNVNLSNWDVSKVKIMKRMFKDSFYFNPEVSLWNVENVVDMEEMFYNSEVNQDLKQWKVNNVDNMSKMFYNSKQFNHDLSVWDVDKVNKCDNFYLGAESWNLPKPNFNNCDPD